MKLEFRNLRYHKQLKVTPLHSTGKKIDISGMPSFSPTGVSEYIVTSKAASILELKADIIRVISAASSSSGNFE